MNNKINKTLLNYKEYDYLNQDRKNPLIKILVSYIKPSFLFKSEILTPIHLGRAVERENSKDGIVSDEDLKWLHENCIGDDDFEGNISNVNRRIGFFTGTYWAWKNYEKLGNPEYFGSFGYRRLFEPNFLENIQEYDCIIPYMVDFTSSGPTIREHVTKLQGENTFNIMSDILKKLYPNEIQPYNKYIELTSSYMYEIYVMKKNIFMEFCEWITPLMLEFLKINPVKYGFRNKDSIEAKFVNAIGEIRDVAYLMEILTGYYCYKLINNKNIKVKHQSLIHFISDESKTNKNQLILKLLREKIK